MRASPVAIVRHAVFVKLAALVTQLIDWLRPFFESYGYVIVSVAMFLESAAFTGILVPGDVILAIGGVYAGSGELVLAGVIACGAVFGVLGATAGYVLGRRYGNSLLRRAPILRRFEDRIDQAQASIASNAGKTIVLGRFVTGAAVFVPFVAGASGVRAQTFLFYAIPTMFVWCSALSLLGFIVGNNVETIDRILSSIGSPVSAWASCCWGSGSGASAVTADPRPLPGRVRRSLG